MNPDRHLNDMVECIGAKSEHQAMELALHYARSFHTRGCFQMISGLSDKLRTQGMNDIAEAVAELFTQHANT